MQININVSIESTWTGNMGGELEPLLSVIVPVYNTEPYLVRCIESIKSQTYKNIEIVIVNDCSPGNVSEIVDSYEGIVYIKHDKNKGLFRARVSGYKASHGDYIAFLDSDDYVSPDFYRPLIQSAESLQLDIVAGRTIFDDTEGNKTIRNLHEECFGRELLRGDEVRTGFYSARGSCFVWHTIWNKVYKRSLWEKCISFFDTITDHLIMTEDVLFSSILFYNSNSFCYIQNDGIHYCENEKSATSNKDADIRRYTKNLKDLKLVFDSVDLYLHEHHAPDTILVDLLIFRKYYSRMWRSLQRNLFKGTKYEAESKKIIDDFLPDYFEYSNDRDHYFEKLKTKYNDTNEKIKKTLLGENVKIVSFDIFDTLVCRDVLFPDMIFDLMEKPFKMCTSANLSFKRMRMDAEQQLRKEWRKFSNKEDFSIFNIYNSISKTYGIDKQICDKMCSLECSLEIEHSCVREAVKDLFSLCKYSGKKVILTSDMYLDRNTVEQILTKCGIVGYDKLFLSSDVGYTKYVGTIYENIVSTMKVSANEIVHIGDNWNSDYCKAKEKGLSPIYYPKEYDLFKGRVSEVKTNRLGYLSSPTNAIYTKPAYVEKDPHYSEVLSLIIRKYFDNGYPPFEASSDYNGSPDLLGYSVVGPHLLDVCTWIKENKKRYNAEKVIFLSRDGFLVKKAYDLITNHSDNTAYVRCSRRCLLPHMVYSILDLYDLPIEHKGHSPSTLVELLSFCLDEKAVDEYRQNVTRFSSFSEYSSFIEKKLTKHFDKEKLSKEQEIVSTYYRELIPADSLVFDMGYSGRIPSALRSALGYDVTFLYVYKEQSCNLYESRDGLKIESLYNFTPWISGFFREYLLSDYLESTCEGFVIDDNKIVPKCSRGEENYFDTFAIHTIQKSSLDFIRDYMDTYSESLNSPFVHPYLSIPFETMLSTISDFDRMIFLNSSSDDLMYGGNDSISVYNLWTNEFVRYYSSGDSKNKDLVSAPVMNGGYKQSPFKYKILNISYAALYKTMQMVNSKRRIIK